MFFRVVDPELFIPDQTFGKVTDFDLIIFNYHRFFK
jgi:hypothetical protein